MRKLLTICCTAAVLLLVGGCQLPSGSILYIDGTRSSAPAKSSNLKDNLETLKRTNACIYCYLSGADLQEANLQGANLLGAHLRFAPFSPILTLAFCKVRPTRAGWATQ